MQSTLIILRGNSGSGKSTIAKALQQHLGPNTLYIDQDVVRIEMMNTKDRPNNLAIELIKTIALYGQKHCPFVILEGILSTSRYKGIIMDLIEVFDKNVHTYYFNLPFEETLRRHMTREKRHKFGEEALRRWWKENDLLHVPNEKLITAEMTEMQIIEQILQDIQTKKEIRQ